MNEKEKAAAKEVVASLKQIPADGTDYVRGNLQGRIDGLKKEKEGKEMSERKTTFTMEEAERFEQIVWAMVEKYLGVTVTPIKNDSPM